ncbi:selenoprotein S-like [Chrysoperla carnea]|uniref:selenoprotein S-like n=1 Tax=Chrysoperla carnea TaxID=189513 RepID=UPI001D096F53|nr:selenoprotein S-like [Chrysoperla carnea]
MNFIFYICYFIASNGWYILITSVLLIYVYVNYLRDALDNYSQHRAENQYLNKVKNNPDLFREKALAMEEARLKMQDKYALEAEKYKEKQQLLEQLKQDKKRRTYVCECETKIGYLN